MIQLIVTYWIEVVKNNSNTISQNPSRGVETNIETEKYFTCFNQQINPKELETIIAVNAFGNQKHK